MPQLGKRLLVPPTPSSAAARAVPGSLLRVTPGCVTRGGREPSLCSASQPSGIGPLLHLGECTCRRRSCAQGLSGGGALHWFHWFPTSPCWEILRLAAVSREQYFAEKPRHTHVLLYSLNFLFFSFLRNTNPEQGYISTYINQSLCQKYL